MDALRFNPAASMRLVLASGAVYLAGAFVNYGIVPTLAVFPPVHGHSVAHLGWLIVLIKVYYKSQLIIRRDMAAE